ncbi:alpha/beta hydrolase domain-containing protein [Fusicatenibacter sp.]
MSWSGSIGFKEPYIAINTESENRSANWAGDSDLPDMKFRTYQIPGTSHDAWYNMLDYYEGYLHDDAAKYNFELSFGGAEGEPLDTPYQYIFHAALRNLYVWVREGVPTPHAPKIEMVPAKPGDLDALTAFNPNSATTKFENKKDVFGNTMGGIRMACMDYPVGRYVSHSKKADGSYDPMFGTVYPFAPEQLKAMYGGLEHYKELVEKSAAESVALGFLLKEDVPAYVEFTVNMAKRRGLH